ncbi:hypothetical protein EC988_007548 [Linderina pennispora]|nr:hypothetical protein EC988_007548 [Linderina pennispora]
MSAVKPFDYDKAGTADVIGQSTVNVEGGSKKAKRNAKARDRKAAKGKGGFDPYSEMALSRDLAKRPNKTRVNTNSGNRSMSFKKVAKIIHAAMTFDISQYLDNKDYVNSSHPMARKHAQGHTKFYTLDGSPPPPGYATTFLAWTMRWKSKCGDAPVSDAVLAAVRQARYALMDDYEYCQMRERELDFHWNVYLQIKAGTLRLSDDSVLPAFRSDLKERTDEHFASKSCVAYKYSREDPEVAIQRVANMLR